MPRESVEIRPLAAREASLLAQSRMPMPTVPERDESENYWKGNIVLLGGFRGLNEDDWAPLEDQPVLGLELDFHRIRDWLGFELGFQGSENRESFMGVDGEAGMTEVYFGPRKTFGKKSAHLYVALGPTFVSARQKFLGMPESEFTPGVCFYGVLARHLVLGIDLRVVRLTSTSFFGVDGDADYEQLAGFVGWGFRATGRRRRTG